MERQPRRARVAAEVRAQLARQQITLQSLAFTTGIAHRTLARRISGETPFDIDELEEIALALGVPMSDLWGDAA